MEASTPLSVAWVFPCPRAACSPLSSTAKRNFPMGIPFPMFMAPGWEMLTTIPQQPTGEAADTSGCLAKEYFFLPLPERTRNHYFPPLTGLRRIPRPSALGLVSSHLVKEAAVVFWTRLGTYSLRPLSLETGTKLLPYHKKGT